MLHCRAAIPLYKADRKRKFNVNWGHGGLKHEWEIFWW